MVRLRRLFSVVVVVQYLVAALHGQTAHRPLHIPGLTRLIGDDASGPRVAPHRIGLRVQAIGFGVGDRVVANMRAVGSGERRIGVGDDLERDQRGQGGAECEPLQLPSPALSVGDGDGSGAGL